MKLKLHHLNRKTVLCCSSKLGLIFSVNKIHTRNFEFLYGLLQTLSKCDFDGCEKPQKCMIIAVWFCVLQAAEGDHWSPAHRLTATPPTCLHTNFLSCKLQSFFFSNLENYENYYNSVTHSPGVHYMSSLYNTFKYKYNTLLLWLSIYISSFAINQQNIRLYKLNSCKL